jgi:hypothetical protein
MKIVDHIYASKVYKTSKGGRFGDGPYLELVTADARVLVV